MRRLRGALTTDLAVPVLVGLALLAVAATIAWAILASNRAPSSPRIPEAQARATALQWVSSTVFGPPPTGKPVTGWTVTSDKYLSSSLRVTDSSGRLVHTESTTWPCLPVLSRCPGGPVWEVELSAPSQAGFATYEGIVLVDAITGKVSAASSSGHN